VSPNGRLVAYIGGSTANLMLMNTDGSHRHLLMRATRGFDYANPVWSPDGRLILVRRDYGTHKGEKCCHLDLWLVRPDGRAVRQIESQYADEGRAAWQPLLR